MIGSLEKRFWKRVSKSGDDECWEWLGWKDKDGYGGFYWKDITTRAHRASWIIAHGKIPKGMCVCHHCDNPSCVRPGHLFLGTMTENIKDRDIKNRNKGNFESGERHRMSKLTRKEIIRIRSFCGDFSDKEIAKIFGISRRYVNSIRNYRVWNHA